MLLSILIPVYNAERYLRRCLDSITKQVNGDDGVEIIIVNDGSTDGSLDIIKEYAGRYPCVRWTSRENRGIGPTRNELIDEAQGEYFWFVDADDFISDHALSTVLPLLRAGKYDMLMFAFNWVSTDGHVEVKHCHGEYASGLEMADHDVYNNSLWTRIYRRSAITENGIRFQKLQMGEDFDVIFHAIPYLGPCLCIDQPLYNYVVSPGSAITNRKWEHVVKSSDDSLICMEGCFRFLRQWGKDSQWKLRKPLNFFLMGYLFSIYVEPFSLKYKLRAMQRLKHAGVFPIKPLPVNPRHRRFSRIINIMPLRYLSIIADVALLKIKG